jgi:hypothetical protein
MLLKNKIHDLDDSLGLWRQFIVQIGTTSVIYRNGRTGISFSNNKYNQACWNMEDFQDLIREGFYRG